MHNLAICVRSVTSCYGKGKEKILDSLSMNVEEGSIYGLTGSSGCGKSTLISCTLGAKRFQSGHILLYGHNIQASETRDIINIPGMAIGYMPQDVALYLEFTIKELFAFFGQLLGMSSKSIKIVRTELMNLLLLPNNSCLVKQLSGGEKRRVSLAVTLMHSPKLLILDEPTVGMDPLLRVRIWEHLRNLVDRQKVTVLVSTHYIDELRQANKIGVMRKGKIITEQNPQAMLESMHVNSLDVAVANLCRDNTKLNEAEIQLNEPEYMTHQRSSYWKSTQQSFSVNAVRRSYFRVRAFLWKNLLTLFRDFPQLMTFVCLPVIQMIVAILIGYEPSGMKLGVVNYELDNKDSESLLCPEYIKKNLDTCLFDLLSCQYLEHVSAKRIHFVHFESEEKAKSAVNQGNTYGYIKFSNTFSTSLASRFINGSKNTTWENIYAESQITTRLDETNAVITAILLAELYRAQEDFISSLLFSCGEHEKLGKYPLQYKAPVFGEPDYYGISDYFAPGITIVFIFYIAIISMGLHIVWEKGNKTLDRLCVIGVHHSEIFLAYFLSGFCLVTMQALVLFLVYTFWFPMNNFSIDKAATAFLLISCADYMGLPLGVFLGLLCKEQIQVAIFGIGFILPNVILGGGVSPIQSMPVVMQGFVPYLPCTTPLEALRSVWNRNFDLSHPLVWGGFVVYFAYVFAFIVLIALFTLRK